MPLLPWHSIRTLQPVPGGRAVPGGPCCHTGIWGWLVGLRREQSPQTWELQLLGVPASLPHRSPVWSESPCCLPPSADSSAGGREAAPDEDAPGDGASVVPAAWVQTCPRPPLHAAATSCCLTSRGGTEGAAAPCDCLPPRAGAAEMGPSHPQGVTQIAQSCLGRQRGGERTVMPTPSGAQVAEGGFSATRGVLGCPRGPPDPCSLPQGSGATTRRTPNVVSGDSPGTRAQLCFGALPALRVTCPRYAWGHIVWKHTNSL